MAVAAAAAPGNRHHVFLEFSATCFSTIASASTSRPSAKNYDSRGRVISRESTSGNTTTVYDAGGRNVGRVTTNR
jgi:YD repeat-containing protein